MGDKLRVISGYLKNRKIDGYDILGTRATMDRVKESVFASINSYLKDAVFLDLFSGSGSIGIEAISNGAKICYFNDINNKAIKVIKNNINKLNISNAIILNKDYKDSLLYFKNNNIIFDIIYIDSPYNIDCYNDILDKLIKNSLINENSIVILEHNKLLDISNNYEIIKNKKYGNKFITVCQKK